jgi:LPPG:FO 2-phospho-L-lactate transferase
MIKEMMLAVLSGGTGTPKLLQGLARLAGQEKISVIVNTAEDVEISGLYVSPDIDTVMYTLAGIVNEGTWYGIREDTFFGHEMLGRIGGRELLRLGDRDRAVSLRRTQLLREGKTLSKVTLELCERLNVRARVMPMSDDRVRTVVHTEAGALSFHEFWVARRARDRVTAVTFQGIEKAKPAPGVIEALEESEAIIIGPSNPVTSTGPILRVREIGAALSKHKEKVIAVSPIVGNAPVSGPAGVLMGGLGYEVSPVGVAKIYRDFVSVLLVDEGDRERVEEIAKLGIRAVPASLLMPDLSSRMKLARMVLETVI